MVRNCGKAILAFCFCALLFAPAAAKAEATANALLQRYDSSTPDEKQLTEFAVEQTENGIGWANSYLFMVRKEPPIFCPPSNVGVSGSQILEMLRRGIREEPTLGQYPFGMAVVLALQKYLPCPEETQSKK
ncbi:MAG: hypothetical protein WC464_00380 [Bdellovibrionales bacterium]